MVSPFSGSATSGVSITGDYRIDALIGGAKWGGAAGNAATITFSFPQSGSTWSTSTGSGYGPTSGDGEPWAAKFAGLTTAQQAAFRAALSTWSDVANVTFVEVADTASNVGDIRVAWTGAIPDAYAAWAYYPFSGPVGGDVWLNPDTTSASFTAGSYAFMTLIHELGHALGLKHPFDGVTTLPSAEDSYKYSLMSYTGYGGAGSQPQTPMLYDVLAIQAIYGANMSTRAGDTVYTFSAGNAELRTIWDGGGNDTLDLSNQTIGAHVNLLAGSFSSIGRKPGGAAASENIAIAFNCVIENAVGTAYADTLSGNAAGNNLSGGGGNDSIDGGAGRDTVLGGDGNDTLSGGRDMDLIDGGAGNDTADFRHATAAASIDLVSGVVDYGSPGIEMMVSIENVFGTNGANTITGTDAANRIDGAGGHDRIDGGGGDDTLIGGTGNDTLAGGAGVDRLDGGSGSDTADFSDATAGVNVSLLAGTADAGDGGVETLISIENVIGGGGADTIIGSAGSNRLEGGDGDDSIDGGAGRDTVLGGDGDDTMSGGRDMDVIDGGNGNDSADFRHATAAASIDLVTGVVDYGSPGIEVMVSIENVFGTNGANTITGTDGANRIDGAGGHDTLIGGGGDDTLTGGSGNDVFRFGAGFGSDTILDFDANGNDRLQIDSALGIAGFAALDLDGDGVLATGDFGVTVEAGSTTLVLDGNTLLIVGDTTLMQADFLFV